MTGRDEPEPVTGKASSLAPYAAGGRIPFGQLTVQQRQLVDRWLTVLGVDVARVDSGSLIERDGSEWRIGLRLVTGGYVMVRRADPTTPVRATQPDALLDPAALASDRWARGGLISTVTYPAPEAKPFTRADLEAAIRQLQEHRRRWALG